MSDNVKSALQTAIKGLQYMSESDEPFKVVDWPATGDQLTVPDLLRLSGNDADTPVEERPLDKFFDDAVSQQEDDAAAFQNLRTAIAQHVSNAKLYRVGEVRFGIYIVGSVGDRWVGVKTRAVET